MCRHAAFALLALVAALAVACGDGGPSSPSGADGVVVEGVVLGDGAAFTASSRTPSAGAKAQKVTVTVEGTTITAEVSANGTFRLQGIPSGTFTLVFLVDGVPIGSFVVIAGAGSEVKVVVQVKDAVLVVVEIKVEGPEDDGEDCVVNGGKAGSGIELEGDVLSGTWSQFDMRPGGERSSGPVTVYASSARCVGGAKTDGDCKEAVKAGAKVHVRGTLMTCTAPATVTATEVKVQKD